MPVQASSTNMSEAGTASQATTRMTSAASAQDAPQGAAGDGLDARRTVSKEAPEDDEVGRKVEEYAGDDEMGFVADRRQSREWGEFVS